MGSIFAKVFDRFLGTKEVRFNMIGLDAAGKTTILYKLKIGEIVTTIPTIGFNVETIKYKNINFTCWDVGGGYKLRELWRQQRQGMDGVIFVVDSHDRDRIDLAREEFQQIKDEEEFKDAIVLIFANKQDLNGMSVDEIGEKLGLALLTGREIHIQGCSATTGEGLYEGLEWLSSIIRKKN